MLVVTCTGTVLRPAGIARATGRCSILAASRSMLRPSGHWRRSSADNCFRPRLPPSAFRLSQSIGQADDGGVPLLTGLEQGSLFRIVLLRGRVWKKCAEGGRRCAAAAFEPI